MINDTFFSMPLLAALGLLVLLLAALGWQQWRVRGLQELLAQERRVLTQLQLDGRDLQAEARLEAARAVQLAERLDALGEELRMARDELREQGRQLLASHRQAEAARTQAEELRLQVQAASEANAGLRQAREQQQMRQEALLQEHATLQSTLAQKELHFAEQQQLLKDSREQLKLEFEQLAGRIFEARGQAFTLSSRQSLDEMLKPFREQIEGFRARVEDIHHKDARQQASLGEQLRQLQELNRQITQEAQELTTALKGQKKMQGNWGELILENVLDRSGLVAGRDYQREVSFSGEDGRRRPDAIVHLPQGKHLIIDAKVSLNAYTRYVNAQDEVERKLALAEHVRAFAERIRELAERHYYDLPGLNAPDMVFMFVPIESAFVEALKADEGLFQKAVEQNVLVATPTTLLTSLNIVRQLWRFEDQSRHAAELADRAARVYDKLRGFLGSMDGVGKSLEKAQDAYRKACDQLVLGRGNLVKQVNDFRQLGVAVKSEIGEPWVERAELELALSLTPPDPETV